MQVFLRRGAAPRTFSVALSVASAQVAARRPQFLKRACRVRALAHHHDQGNTTDGVGRKTKIMSPRAAFANVVCSVLRLGHKRNEMIENERKGAVDFAAVDSCPRAVLFLARASAYLQSHRSSLGGSGGQPREGLRYQGYPKPWSPQ
jgi:hypothetical protein